MQLYNHSYVFDAEDDQGRELMLKAFGKNIKNLRIKGGLTQEKLAERAGINGKYLGEIERGEKNPSAVVVYRISQALGVSVSEIFSDDPSISEDQIKEVERLFAGKKKKDIQKAIRILEVFFE